MIYGKKFWIAVQRRLAKRAVAPTDRLFILRAVIVLTPLPAPSAPTTTTHPGAPTAPSGSTPAKAPQAVQQATGLPVPGKGKGSVPPNQRDPKRVWTKTERQQQLEKQDGKCAQCGAQKTVGETNGHHKV